MRIVAVGGGPAALYLAILLKRDDPRHDIVVYERNRLDDTFGFGVVFSDATAHNLAEAEPEVHAAISRQFFRWDDIHIHFRDQILTSTGHGFSGLARTTLLDVLAARARELGVDLRFQAEITDVDSLRDCDLLVAADGASSTVRERYADHFQPTIDWRLNRFVWLGTTKPFPAFTFYFKETPHGLWRVHAYQYAPGHSTFIVEGTERTWCASGMAEASESDALAYCEDLFGPELNGHRLLTNKSVWRRFPTIRNARWWHENMVLIGDAAHTAHFSIGSGTKLAMEDGVALAAALRAHPGDVRAALMAYEEERRPAVASAQRAAQVSLQWFEDTERYMDLEPIQFGFNLLTRSLRVTHENLRERDPAYVREIDRWFADSAGRHAGPSAPSTPVRPPMFTPFALRDMVLENRVVVSPICQYSAEDGTPNEWHLVHLGARAIGGAGLVFAEMTDVSPEARISPWCTGMYKPEHVEAWRRIVDFVHENSYAKIALQLGHAGRKAATKRMWEGDVQPLEHGGWPIVSASPIPYFDHSPVPREMTREDMLGVVREFERATTMANDAGFDMLEVHFAHGYLLASFVSPLTNLRDDDYGGTLDNRLRFPLEVFDAVRAKWPRHKPMSVRISAVDWAPGGMEAGDAVEVARRLKDHDCDIVDVSAGQTVPHQQPVYGRLFQTPFADRIRREIGLATMAVGNISSFTDVNTILAAGRADLCMLARAHLWDPYWTRHAAYELGVDLPWPEQYATLNSYTPRFK
jgi:anthraniloyl-CoA monooxygenase